MSPDPHEDAEPLGLPPDGSLSGQLLVAAPVMGDPNFNQTVVMMLEHGPLGSVGVVLNRPTPAPVHEVLPDWADPCADPPMVFSGGPVERTGVVAVAEVDLLTDGVTPVSDRLAVIDLELGPEHYGAELTRLRLFAGYSGWGPGQLEDELEERAWYVLDGEPDDVFCREPRELWTDVLRRAGGTLARLASIPLN